MTSTTLSFKSNFAPAFRKTFKQRLVSAIALLVVGGAAAVITLIISTSSSFMPYSYSTGYNKVELDVAMLVLSVILAGLCGVFSLTLCPNMFSEIYKKQSCDLYFSLPVKRENYFDACYLYGAAVNTVGFLLPLTLFAAVAKAMSNSTTLFTLNLKALIPVAITILLAVISIYSAFVMCAVTAGKRLQYIFLALICLLCTSQVVNGIVVNLNSIWGMSISSSTPFAIDPIQNVSNVVFSLGKQKLVLCVISLTEAIGMFVAGRIIFKKRNAEVAEVTLSGKAFPCFLLVLLCASAFIRYSTLPNLIIALIVGIVAAVLVSMLFTAIAYRKAFTPQTIKSVIAVCVVGCVFVASVNLPSYSFFVKNIPDADKVESVAIEESSAMDVYISSVLNIFASTSYSDEEHSSGIKITDEEGIKNAIALHQKLVDDDVIKASKKKSGGTLLMYIIDIDNVNYNTYNDYSCKITYTLKSGKTLTRSYSAYSSLLVNEFSTLMKNENILSQLDLFADNDENYLAMFVDAGYYYDDEELTLDGDEDFDYYFDRQQISADSSAEFKEIFIKDMLALDNYEFIESLYGMGGTNFYPSLLYDYCNAETVAEVMIFTINPTAPDDVKQKLREMSPIDVYNSRMYTDYSTTNSPINYVEMHTVSVNSHQPNTIDYLKTHGVVLNY